MDENQICSFLGCNNTNLNKKSCFYEFPEDFNLCIQWVEIIGCREFFEEFAFHGPQPFRGKFICSDHFTEEDFIDRNDISSGLKQDAVPFYFIPNRKPEGSMKNITVKSEPPAADFWDANDINSSIFPVEMLSNIKVEDVSSQFISSGDGFLSNMDFSNNIKRAHRTARRYSNENPEQLAIRRYQNAQRASLRRQMETPEEKEVRKRANAERQARKRMMETPEQKEIRRVKDVLRARRRRGQESEEETKRRRLYDTARAQERRQNESLEEKMLRRYRDLERVAKRRRKETEQERLQRLKKNREYSAKRRHVQKLEQELSYPKNLVDDTFLALRNFEQDVTAINPSFFRSLTAYSGQQGYNNFKHTEARLNNDDIIAQSLNASQVNSLAYSLMSTSSDSQSLDGTSEESVRSYSNDSSDNQVDDELPNVILENHNGEKGQELLIMQT